MTKFRDGAKLPSPMASKTVRVRFAPSPTGFLHIGGLRTALYNWLFARKHGGTFLLRVEDTDRSRYVEGAIENLYESLLKMDLKPDEGVAVENGGLVDHGKFGPYLQSKRREKHLAYAYELIEKDAAYYCFCTKERLDELADINRKLGKPSMYDGHCRALSKKDAENKAAVGDAHVIRLKVPREGKIVMHDLIRGKVEIPWEQIDDQVIIKSDGFPTYHLAATCDDHDMEISHVIRGEEWLSSLPKHIFIYEAMGWEPPQFAHLPLLLNADRSKLSKRQGDVAVEDYLKKGYLPEALVNFVALLGWNPTADREIFSKEELAELFEIEKVNKAGAVFNTEKLDWLNGEYIKNMSKDAFRKTAELFTVDLPAEAELKSRAGLIFQDRIKTFAELPELVGEVAGELPDYLNVILPWKKSTPDEARERLIGVRALLDGLDEGLFDSVQTLESAVLTYIKDKGWGNGDTLWPLRIALSGKERSPSPFELLFVLGKDESLRRIDEAMAKLA